MLLVMGSALLLGVPGMTVIVAAIVTAVEVER